MIKKKLLLIIEDIDTDVEYFELLKLAKKADENIDQIFIDINNSKVYCYGYERMNNLTA